MISTTSDESIIIPGTEYTITTHGVKVCLIDFNLSRATDDKGHVHAFDIIDEEIFTGYGDIQYDVYRSMRQYITSNGDQGWQGFHPKTNVFWLDYLVQKILEKAEGVKDEGGGGGEIRDRLVAFGKRILDCKSADQVAQDEFVQCQLK